MEATVWAAFIAAAGSVMAAIVSAVGVYKGNERKRESDDYRTRREAIDRENERRRQLRDHERDMMDEAIQDSLLTLMEAEDVALVALSGGHLNGNVEDARKSLHDSKARLQQTRTKALTKIL